MDERPIQRRSIPRDASRLVVTQSNDLAGSIQDMTLTEKRCVLLAAAVIRQADIELSEVRFDMGDYRRIYGVVNNNLATELFEIVPSITTRNIVLPHGKRSRTSFSVVSKFTIVSGVDSETGRAYGVIELHRDMIQFFLGLGGNFFSMPLLVYSAYRSNYALRLGEILASSSRGDKHYTVSFTTEDLKTRLNCPHYKNFAQFRRRVLEPAKQENDDIGYLTFDWEEHKNGRSIDHLSFKVSLKKDVWAAEHQRTDLTRLALDNKLRKLGFDQIPADYYEILGSEGVQDVVNDVLKRVKERQKTDKAIRNPGAYLRTRLDGEIERARGMLPFSVHHDPDEADVSSKRITTSQQRFKLSDELAVAFNQARVDHAVQTFETLLSPQRDDLNEAVTQDVTSPIPTLIAPTLKATAGKPIPEHVRRIALIRLLERNNLVTYEQHLKDPRAFAYYHQWFEEYAPDDREAIIAISVEQLRDEL